MHWSSVGQTRLLENPNWETIRELPIKEADDMVRQATSRPRRRFWQKPDPEEIPNGLAIVIEEKEGFVSAVEHERIRGNDRFFLRRLQIIV